VGTSDLQDVILVKHLARHAQVFRHQPAGRDPAALAVAAVAHLDGRLVDMPAADGNRAGEPGHAAAALGLGGWAEPGTLGPQIPAGPENGFHT